MKTSILTLISLILLSSCSVMKKNGYYQSRSYKPNKKLSLIAMKKHASSQPIYNIDASAREQEVMHSKPQLSSTFKKHAPLILITKSFGDQDLRKSKFRSSSLSDIQREIQVSAGRNKNNTLTIPYKLYSNSSNSVGDPVNIIAIILSLLALIGLFTTTLSLLGFIFAIVPLGIALILVVGSRGKSRSTRATWFGVFLFSLCWASLLIGVESTFAIVMSLSGVVFTLGFLLAIALLILALVWYIKSVKEKDSE